MQREQKKEKKQQIILQLTFTIFLVKSEEQNETVDDGPQK